jgi:hypothetical protein
MLHKHTCVVYAYSSANCTYSVCIRYMLIEVKFCCTVHEHYMCSRFILYIHGDQPGPRLSHWLLSSTPPLLPKWHFLLEVGRHLSPSKSPQCPILCPQVGGCALTNSLCLVPSCPLPQPPPRGQLFIPRRVACACSESGYQANAWELGYVLVINVILSLNSTPEWRIIVWSVKPLYT